MEDTVLIPQLQEDSNIHFERFSDAFKSGNHSPLNEIRKSALESLNKLQFPTIKNEEWKYTSLKSLLATGFNLEAEGQLQNFKNLLGKFPSKAKNQLVFTNGMFSEELSTIAKNQAFVIADAFKSYDQQQAIIETHFGKYADASKEAFVALNTSFNKNVVLVHIPKNCSVESPIEILFLHDANTHAVISQPRILVVVEQSASVKINDRHLVDGAHEVFANVVIETFVAANANCTISHLQNVPENVSIVTTNKAFQNQDSVFTDNVVTTHGKLIRNNLDIVLDGSNTEANMNGLYMIDGKTHVDNHTSVDHKMPHANSNELYKGIMDGEANAVFNGKIFVRQDAQKTNAFQSNNNILLSDKASIDTKPQLEIWADDVKCSHGATIGALDEDPLFYLQARGIPKNKARALLLEAFANDVSRNISDENFKAEIEALVETRF